MGRVLPFRSCTTAQTLTDANPEALAKAEAIAKSVMAPFRGQTAVPLTADAYDAVLAWAYWKGIPFRLSEREEMWVEGLWFRRTGGE